MTTKTPEYGAEKTVPSEHVETVPSNNEASGKLETMAGKATLAEHERTIMETLRLHWKSVMWSMIVSLSIVMEGYDTNLIGNFYAYPEFKRKYGLWVSESAGYQVEAKWQTALSDAVPIGAFVGVWMNGILTDWLGHRHTLIISLVVLTGAIFGTFFAPSVEVLFVGEVLCGIPWGIIATIGVTYASEVCPMKLRGYLANYVNLCWVIGQLIGAGVMQGCLRLENQWAYRIPFAVQWIWPPIIIAALLIAPDSPWWLVRKGRPEDAKKALSKLNYCTDEENETYIAMITKTNELEKSLQAGATFMDCFKGEDLRRTEICCLAFAGQIMAGSTFLYSPTYLFEQAGVNTEDSYKLSVGGYACGFVGTTISWLLISKFGRRSIYLTGQLCLCTTLAIIGFLTIGAEKGSGAAWGQAAFSIIWLFVYSATIGPLAYAVVSETSSTRLRNKTVCLARNSYYVFQVVGGVFNSYMLNPGEWNWRGYSGFFWFGSCFILFVWAYFRLPECRNRTYEELDLLFARKVSARKFAKADLSDDVIA